MDGENLELKIVQLESLDESNLVSATLKMSTFYEIKLDIFLNLFQTEFIFSSKKMIFLGFFKHNFFISEISEWLSKELTSSLNKRAFTSSYNSIYWQRPYKPKQILS